MIRNCEVCKSKKKLVIYKQKFYLINNKNFSYNICYCKKCYFIYAVHPYSSSKLEDYYKDNLTYSYQYNRGNIPEDAQKLNQASFYMIDNYFKKNYRQYKSKIKILDIGCGNGYLLSLFKKNKYKYCYGIEPSKLCSVFAKKKYKIRIIPKTLSEFRSKDKYDLIIFGSVLEHIKDLNKNILKVKKLLKDKGIIFISVPDTSNFGKILKEPFLEFSLEHINYFTKNSLNNLLLKHYFKNVKFKSLLLKNYGSYALNSLWIRTKKTIKIKKNKSDIKKIKSYIKKSELKLKNIKLKINKLVKTQEKIIVWGTGSLTSRLLATTNLTKTNIQFFIDSDVNKQNSEINNTKIYSPKSLIKNINCSLFILSFVHSKEIEKTARNIYKFTRKIIKI
jgi:2-polyprenyl-3-methyl-5-hydroxy-6-metoxy-1,4-benzoquinol methylase